MSRPVHASRALLTIALVLCLAAAPQKILAQDTATYATKAKAVSDLVVEGMKLEVKGNYQESLPILERALALAEKSFDPDDGMIYIPSLSSVPAGNGLCTKGELTVAIDQDQPSVFQIQRKPGNLCLAQAEGPGWSPVLSPVGGFNNL